MRCEEKKVFISKRLARIRAAQVHKHGYAKPRVYRCKTCGFWHFTTADADSRAFFRRGVR